MKRVKKIVAAGILLSLVTGLFAGCNSPEKDRTSEYLQRPETYQNEAVGADAYLAMDRMAFINLGSYNYAVSSAGRANGNSDGFDGKNWLYIDGNGDHVICEAKGKGIVNRIWTTGTYNEQAIVKIYIDNADEPVYADYYYNFTKGTTKPFLYPITKFWNQSAGGRVNYLPIEFSEYLKIAIEDPGQTNLFWYVDYSMLDENQQVTPFTGEEDLSAVSQMWTDTGLDFKSGMGVTKDTAERTLASGEAYTYFRLDGAKQIQSIKIKIPGLELPDTASDPDSNTSSENLREELTGLRLKIYWDGEETPSVDCSLAAFFGIGTLGYNNEVKGLFFGVKDGVMYNYFPMPFEKSAELVVENGSGKAIDVSVEVRYKDVDYDFYNVGYFKTCEKNLYVDSADPLEVCLLSETGSGKVVSIQLNCFGNSGNDVTYEEGDIRIYVDGSRTPQLVSPGTEDFFNGAGYFLDGSSNSKRGLYTTQLSGYTNWYVNDDGANAISVYRVFANDAVVFRNGISFCIEHGGGDRNPNVTSWHRNQSVGYESLICYYHTPVQRMEQTDSMDMDESSQTEAHDFRAEGTVNELSVTSGFASGFDLVELTLNGVSHTDAVSFRMELNPDNHGAVLYRLFDYSVLNSGASVYVDGEYAGQWYKAGYNDVYRFCEDAFVIPASLTEGKEQITVRIVPDAGCTWTAMEYSIYSIIDKTVFGEEIASGDVINILSGGNALTVSGDGLAFSSVDSRGGSDFRLVRYYDGSYFLLNSGNGSVLASKDGKLTAEKITLEKLDERYRWTLEKTDKGYIIRNLADSGSITSGAGLSADGTVVEIQLVKERKRNIF